MRCKLKEICKPKQWKTIATDMLGEEGYPVYGANGIIGYYKEYNHEKETLLVTCRGATCGSLNICQPYSYVNGNAMALDELRDDVNIKYLYYFLKARGFSDVISGSAQPQIIRSAIEQVEVEIKSIDEQREIVKRLEFIEQTISDQNVLLGQTDMLIKSRFVEMFGDLANPECTWDKCQFIDACADKDDIKCGPFGTQLSKDEYTESGVAVWEIPQINKAFLSTPTHFLAEEKAEQLKAYTIVPGDIAMSRKGNVGKCALFPESYPKGIIHSDVLRIRVDKKRVNPVFMMCQLHFSGAVTRQIELVSSGAIMAGVNVTKLKQISVHIPPIELQEQFADFVRQVDKLKFT